ncbi:MAG TPA: VWA domain-containing protein [Pyrinomonadaceae bacterium]|nr:VWA domain-containing protein [Pyrinomonadaceae bacterium]
MKTVSAVTLFLLCFVSIISAQSGRKIKAEPPPVAKTVEEKGDYSESIPSKRIKPKYEPRFKNVNVSKDEQAKTQTIETKTEGEDEVVKIETQIVTIPVSVFDRNGLYIPNLRRNDFKIYEDGKEQEIAYFGTTDKPFTVVLLIDTSPSTQYKIEEIQTAAKAFVNQLEPQDSVIVIEFDGNVHVLSEVTKDRQQIFKAIDKADFGEGTSLYDAVSFSLNKRLNQIEGRKAIVLFTDGVDTASHKADYDSTIRDAEEADTLIFPIYYNTFFQNQTSGGVMSSPFPFPQQRQPQMRGTRPQDYALGKKYLDELSESTGGRVFRPEATAGGLTAAFEGIAEELRRQYNIGYYPTEEGKAGQRKNIKVRVNRPNLVIRARDSYIVGSETKPS